MKDSIEKVRSSSTLLRTSIVAISASLKNSDRLCQSMLDKSIKRHSVFNGFTMVTSPSKTFLAFNSIEIMKRSDCSASHYTNSIGSWFFLSISSGFSTVFSCMFVNVFRISTINATSSVVICSYLATGTCTLTKVSASIGTAETTLTVPIS
jgi:hypothetical protein